MIGLEVELSGKEARWKGIKLRLRGDNISHDECYTPEIGTLQAIPLKRMPVVLAFTGENVIVKRVQAADEFTMLSRLMPVSRQEDFFYQIDPAGEDGYCRAVLIRKADIEQVLEALRPSGCFIVDITPGESAIDRAAHFLKTDEGIAPAFFTAYAAALSFFMDGDHSRFYRFFPRYRMNDYAYYRKFKFFLVGGSILLAGIFTINLIVSRSQNDKLTRYMKQAGTTRALLEEMDRINAKRAEYAGYIVEKGLGEESRHAFYCDRIACLTPDGIRLTRLEIETPGRKIKENEEIQYRERTILISGTASSPVDVDQFMKEMLKEEWVEKIVHHDYSTVEGKNLFHVELRFIPGIP